jgi:hypothetical protein
MNPLPGRRDPHPMRERLWPVRGGLALAALLLLYAALALGSAARKSVTVDELGHLPSGLHYLQTGDARFTSLNPPLVNVLSALPVLALDLSVEPRPPAASDDPFSFWSTGYAFHERHRDDYLRIYATARLVPIAIVAALGVLVYLWARELAPRTPELAGLLAAGFVCLSPNVIAQARLVGTDTGTAFFVVLALYCFRRMLLRPTPASVVLAGLTLGLAQLTKFYALLLYPVTGLLIFVWHRLSPAPRPPLARVLVRYAAVLATSWIVLVGGYSFGELGASLSELRLSSDLLQSWQTSLFGALPLPLPAAYLRAFDGQLVELGSALPSFLLGERFLGGRWDYYLILLAIKSPLPLMIAFAAAMVLFIRRPALETRELALLLAYPVLLFVLLSLGDRRQLGARALLSAVPLVQLCVAVTLSRNDGSRWVPRLGVAALTGLMMVSLWTWPDYLSYFNVAAGGSQQGYRLASDANIDIGQDLVQLAEYLRDEGVEQVQLLYFGSVDPALYGIDYVVPTPETLRPGPVAVSVSLYQLTYPTYDHGQLRPIGPFSPPGEPSASIGGSIHVYEIAR